MLIDTHAHLTDEKFAGDLGEVLKRARGSGVGIIIDVADSVASSRHCIEHAQHYEGVFAAVGIHPNNAAQAGEADANLISGLALSRAVVAIGETGLDFYRNRASRLTQEKLLRRHLRVALDNGLPAIMHCRGAYGELINVLKEMEREGLKGVVHCFSGSRRDAEAIVEMGYSISVGGPLTYPKNDELRKTVACLPMDRLLLETDCPYLSPQQRRGKVNEPAHLVFVAVEMARTRHLSVEEVAAITTASAKRLFTRIRNHGPHHPRDDGKE
jgi:TatD DNase family protein